MTAARPTPTGRVNGISTSSLGPVSRTAGEVSGADLASAGIAAKRVRQLLVHAGIAVLAFVLSVVAVIGGVRSVVAVLVVGVLTFVALILDLRGWRGAGEVWAGRADPSRLRNLTLWSLVFGAPAFVATLIVAVLVVGLPASRLVSSLVRHWPGTTSSWGFDAFGSARWTDPVVVAAVVAALVASAGAAMLSLRGRQPRPTQP